MTVRLTAALRKVQMQVTLNVSATNLAFVAI